LVTDAGAMSIRHTTFAALRAVMPNAAFEALVTYSVGPTRTDYRSARRVRKAAVGNASGDARGARAVGPRWLNAEWPGVSRGIGGSPTNDGTSIS
jgi:hypothetical protein